MAKIIYRTPRFVVAVPDRPHVDRIEGGHIVIKPIVRVEDRTKLAAMDAIELMKLTMVVGVAMSTARNRRGIDIGRINYQDNGNWGAVGPNGPYLHEHLYSRARSAKIQIFGQALCFPAPESTYYDTLSPLDDADIKEIQDEIERILAEDKYRGVGARPEADNSISTA